MNCHSPALWLEKSLPNSVADQPVLHLCFNHFICCYQMTEDEVFNWKALKCPYIKDLVGLNKRNVL